MHIGATIRCPAQVCKCHCMFAIVHLCMSATLGMKYQGMQELGTRPSGGRGSHVYELDVV